MAACVLACRAERQGNELQPADASTPRVFINYRRGDSQAAAGRLYDQLLRHFGRDQLFMDVDAMEPGTDFVKTLDEQVANCSAFIAVIGPAWIKASGSDGSRRLDSPADYVRVEIESALKRDIRVIPVLVDGATMPQPSDLPLSLQPLARRHAVEVAHHRFASDCDALAQSIERAIRGPVPLLPAHAAAPPPPPVHAGDGKLSWSQVIFSFTGRISRQQFLIGMLGMVAVAVTLALAISLTAQTVLATATTERTAVSRVVNLMEDRLSTVINFIFYWPAWALALKRLHDLGQGWNILWIVVAVDVASPIFDVLGQKTISNGLALFEVGLCVMAATIKGTPGPNRYGPDPLARG